MIKNRLQAHFVNQGVPHESVFRQEPLKIKEKRIDSYANNARLE